MGEALKASSRVGLLLPDPLGLAQCAWSSGGAQVGLRGVPCAPSTRATGPPTRAVREEGTPGGPGAGAGGSVLVLGGCGDPSRAGGCSPSDGFSAMWGQLTRLCAAPQSAQGCQRGSDASWHRQRVSPVQGGRGGQAFLQPVTLPGDTAVLGASGASRAACCLFSALKFMWSEDGL